MIISYLLKWYSSQTCDVVRGKRRLYNNTRWWILFLMYSLWFHCSYRFLFDLSVIYLIISYWSLVHLSLLFFCLPSSLLSSLSFFFLSLYLSIYLFCVHISHSCRVHLSKLQSCHVIDYEKHLTHVILTHCKYSLMIGSGDGVTYDFINLEKHILNRFVHGKPSIDVEIPLLSYKSDALRTAIFAKVRQAIPQVWFW